MWPEKTFHTSEREAAEQGCRYSLLQSLDRAPWDSYQKEARYWLQTASMKAQVFEEKPKTFDTKLGTNRENFKLLTLSAFSFDFQFFLQKNLFI